VYRKDPSGKWRAELIDWEFFLAEKGYKGYTNPPEPFEIDPECGYFVPSMMVRYVQSTPS